MIQGTPTAGGAIVAGGRASLTRRDFFAEVADRLRAELPRELAGFHDKRTQNLLKIYYDNERIHYEVWLNSQQRMTEIGLHFEDGPVSTAAYLAYFDRYIVELKHELGPDIELERWTQSWGHVYALEPWTPSAQFTPRKLAAPGADFIAEAGMGKRKHSAGAVRSRPSVRVFRRIQSLRVRRDVRTSP
jgi:hypothetical protein